MLACTLVVPDALAQAQAAKEVDSMTVREVERTINKYQLPIYGLGTVLSLLLLLAGGLLTPGGFEKAGLRKIEKLSVFAWLFAAIMVIVIQGAASGFLVQGGMLDRLDPGGSLNASERHIVVTATSIFLGAFAGLGMLYLLCKSAPEGGLGISFLDIPLGVGCFLLAFPVVQLASIAAVGLYTSISEQPPDPIAHDILRKIVEDFAGGTVDGWTWLIIATAVIGAPLVEELLFRVFIQSALLRILKSPWISVFLTALIFTSIHRIAPNEAQRVPWHALLPIFILGITMGLAYERTRRVGVPITMHVCFNALMVWRAILVSDGYEAPVAEPPPAATPPPPPEALETVGMILNFMS